MTDLKAANEALAKALAALDSQEHDADVREAEAIRNRLIELDGRIGGRIKAKLEAHKAIATAWSPVVQADLTQEAIDDRARYTGFVESMKVGTLTVGFGAINHVANTYTDTVDREIVSELAKNLERYEAVNPAIAEDPTVQFLKAESLADAWQAHHEEHAGKYAMAGDEIPERVLTNGVAEMQQAVHADEQ